MDKAQMLDFVVEVVRRHEGQVGFEVLPRRWVVERTFGWMIRHRRLGRDYERRLDVSEAMIHIALGSLMLRRLCVNAISKRALTFSSAGLGNSTHLYSEMITLRSDIKLRHIPYKSFGPTLLAVMSGEADLMTVTAATGLAQLKAGKIVGIAQSGEMRSPQLADLPLLRELAPDIPALPGWYALVSPAGMNAKVTQTLAASVKRFLTDPVIKRKLIDQFLFPIPGTPADIQKRAENEARIWGGLIRDLKIQID